MTLVMKSEKVVRYQHENRERERVKIANKQYKKKICHGTNIYFAVSLLFNICFDFLKVNQLLLQGSLIKRNNTVCVHELLGTLETSDFLPSNAGWMKVLLFTGVKKAPKFCMFDKFYEFANKSVNGAINYYLYNIYRHQKCKRTKRKTKNVD